MPGFMNKAVGQFGNAVLGAASGARSILDINQTIASLSKPGVSMVSEARAVLTNRLNTLQLAWFTTPALTPLGRFFMSLSGGMGLGGLTGENPLSSIISASGFTDSSGGGWFFRLLNTVGLDAGGLIGGALESIIVSINDAILVAEGDIKDPATGKTLAALRNESLWNYYSGFYSQFKGGEVAAWFRNIPAIILAALDGVLEGLINSIQVSADLIADVKDPDSDETIGDVRARGLFNFYKMYYGEIGSNRTVAEVSAGFKSATYAVTDLINGVITSLINMGAEADDILNDPVVAEVRQKGLSDFYLSYYAGFSAVGGSLGGVFSGLTFSLMSLITGIVSSLMSMGVESDFILKNTAVAQAREDGLVEFFNSYYDSFAEGASASGFIASISSVLAEVFGSYSNEKEKLRALGQVELNVIQTSKDVESVANKGMVDYAENYYKSYAEGAEAAGITKSIQSAIVAFFTGWEFNMPSIYDEMSTNQEVKNIRESYQSEFAEEYYGGIVGGAEAAGIATLVNNTIKALFSSGKFNPPPIWQDETEKSRTIRLGYQEQFYESYYSQLASGAKGIAKAANFNAGASAFFGSSSSQPVDLNTPIGQTNNSVVDNSSTMIIDSGATTSFIQYGLGT